MRRTAMLWFILGLGVTALCPLGLFLSGYVTAFRQYRSNALHTNSSSGLSYVISDVGRVDYHLSDSRSRSSFS